MRTQELNYAYAWFILDPKFRVPSTTQTSLVTYLARLFNTKNTAECRILDYSSFFFSLAQESTRGTKTLGGVMKELIGFGNFSSFIHVIWSFFVEYF